MMGFQVHRMPPNVSDVFDEIRQICPDLGPLGGNGFLFDPSCGPAEGAPFPHGQNQTDKPILCWIVGVGDLAGYGKPVPQILIKRLLLASQEPKTPGSHKTHVHVDFEQYHGIG